MIQAVTQNNALSQNWVKCTVHTPMAQATHRPRALRPSRVHSAVSQRALGLVVARTGTVSWSCLAVSQCTLTMSRAHAAVSQDPRSRYKLCIATQAPAASCSACRSAPASCRRVLLCRIAALLLRIATPNGRPQL